jgi:hypothetical protein
MEGHILRVVQLPIGPLFLPGAEQVYPVLVQDGHSTHLPISNVDLWIWPAVTPLCREEGRSLILCGLLSPWWPRSPHR